MGECAKAASPPSIASKHRLQIVGVQLVVPYTQPSREMLAGTLAASKEYEPGRMEAVLAA